MSTEPNNQEENSKNIVSEEGNHLEIPTKNKPRRRLMLRLFFLIVLLLLILLVFILIMAKLRVKSDKEAIFAQLNNITQQIDEQSQRLSASESAIVMLKRKTNDDQGIWQLDEAKYLMQMANVTLYFQHNISTTIKLLKLADSHLSNVATPGVMEVRKLLADNISVLSDIPTVDISGIYLELGALNQQVEQLPLVLQLQDKTTLAASIPEVSKGHSVIVRALMQSWDAIKKVLVIRHHQTPVDPLLTPDQRGYLNLNLHLLFAQAQLALLNHRDEIFQASLKEIQGAIERYFVQTNFATKSMLHSIQSLQKVNISPELPDINDSLIALKKITELQMNKMSQETNTNNIVSGVEKDGV